MYEFILLDKSSFEQNWNEENFYKEVTGKFDLSILCRKDNRLTGFLFGSTYIWNHQKIAHINRIVTSANYRKQNIGSKLIHYFEKNALNLGIELVTLEFDNTLQVHHFYLNNGFNFLSKLEMKSYLKAKQKEEKLDLFNEGKLNVMIKELQIC